MVSSEIIKERLKEIDENLKLLSVLKEMPFDEFRADIKSFKSAERCLEISIQCLLDICHHIIATNNWPRPKDNKEAIEIIASHKIIPEQFAKDITGMAGLRNILVHEYVKVDLKRIYKHLQDIDDFRKFQKYILKYLKQV